MCEPSLLTISLTLAFSFIIIAFALIGAAIIANNSIIKFYLSPGLMLAAAIFTGLALAALSVLLNQLETQFTCMGSPRACLGEFENLRNIISAMITVLGIQFTACLAAAGISWIPFVGAAPMYAIIGAFVVQIPLIVSLYTFLSHFNSCLDEAIKEPYTTPILVGSFALGLAAIVSLGILRKKEENKRSKS